METHTLDEINKQYPDIPLERRNIIVTVAGIINDMAENYQVAHAVFATDRYINELRRKAKLPEEVTREAKNRLLSCIRTPQQNNQREALEESHRIENEYKKASIHITISYITSFDENVSRVVRLDNLYEICLARSLRDKINETGTPNVQIIQSLRKLVAHELGHLALHFDCIDEKSDLPGSRSMQGAHEKEANFFRDILLFLRKERSTLYNHL